MENWYRFLNEELLNEKLLLKPGPNGWDLYGQLVAEAYRNAPDYEKEAIGAFQDLQPFIEKMFRQMQSKVKVEFVDEDPYVDDQHMKQEVAETGVLKTWTGGTKHPVFSHEFNLKFRAVHDWMAHIQRDTNFGMKGEIQAYNNHLKTIPPSGAPALFTEVVGQAAYFNTYGYFPEQKIATLKGFDYFNLGAVDGYDIVNKELIKIENDITLDVEDEENETFDGEL